MAYHRHRYRDDIAGPTWLYRLYAGTQCLYVGVSSQPWVRLVSHRRKPWWKTVTRVGYRWFSSRADAFAAEKAAITQEAPLYNRARPKVATGAP